MFVISTVENYIQMINISLAKQINNPDNIMHNYLSIINARMLLELRRGTLAFVSFELCTGTIFIELATYKT